VFGAGSLGVLAYLFHDSNLAAIPLVGVALFIVLWPLYEKFRSLQRIAAEFSPTKAIVVAESGSTKPLEGSGSVQNQVATQVQQSQNELAQAIDLMLAQTSGGISEELRHQVRLAIEQYSTLTQQHAAAAIDLLLERLVFEYLLRGPAYWSAVIDHLTYVLFGRTDLVAKQNTATYVNQIATRMWQNNQLAFTTIGEQAVAYLVQTQVSPPAEVPVPQGESTL
jgi:hypothetical protein